METRPLELRGGLRRVAQGLIAYGIIGLVVAAICLVALIWVNGKVGGLRTEADTTVGNLATTMDRTAQSLHDASTTAQSFTVTVEESAQAVSSAADTITERARPLLAFGPGTGPHPAHPCRVRGG